MKNYLKKVNVFFSEHENISLLAYLTITSIAATLYFYIHNEILLYNDARSHLDIARRIVDSLTPGITQIGSIWLPLYQLFQVPFIWNTFLWHSGLSGSIVSGFSYIGASFFMYKILKRLTNSTIISLIGLGIFSLNPNLLYLQAVPLDEVLTLFFINGSLYFLLAWAETKSLYSLVLSSLFVFLGSLVRYEVWMLIIFEVGYIFSLVKQKDNDDKSGTVESYIILFSTLAFFGILIWLVFNFLIWHNAFYFLDSQYSAQSQQSLAVKTGALKTHNNIALSLLVYASDVLENTGYLFGILAVVALIYLLLKNGKTYIKLFYVVTLAPAIFDVVSLFKGETVIYTSFFPSPQTDQVFNTRYGIIGLIPITIILVSAFFVIEKKFKRKIIFYLFLTIIILENFLYFYLTSPINIIDGLNGISSFSKSNNIYMANIIKNNCSQGLTLVSAGKNESGMFTTMLPMKSFIYEGSGDYWNKALSNPQSMATCIAMTNGDVAYQNFVNKQELLQSYRIIFNSSGTIIYKKK
jgi:hypothetical protein